MTEQQRHVLKKMLLISHIILIVVIVSFVISMLFMHKKLDENINKRFELDIISNINTAALYEANGSDLASMVSESAGVYTSSNKAELLNILKTTVNTTKKLSISSETVNIAFADGTVLYSNGITKNDTSVFSKAYENYKVVGNSNLTFIKESPFSGIDCVAYLEPIMASDGTVVGMVSVENSLDEVLKTFKRKEVEGLVLLRIYDENFNEVIGYENQNGANEKILESLSAERKDLKLLASNASEEVKFVNPKIGTEYLMFERPIFNNGYKVLVVVNEKVYGENEYQISAYARLVFAVAFIGMCLFFFMMIMIQRSKMSAMRNTIYYNMETGLSTMERALDVYSHLKNKGKGYTIATLRSNDFGLFNELFGYEVVDQIIADVSNVILKGINDKCELGMKSQGKASFIILLKDSEGNTEERLDKILSNVNTSPITDGDIIYSINPHFTLTTYEITGEERDLFQVLNNLELNTTMGINDTKTSESVLADIIDDIPEAFEKNQFIPVFEIRKDIFTDEVVGADLSVCWDHPRLGKIKEQDFMRVLEVKHSSIRLELYMAEQASKLIKKWTDNKMMPLPIGLKILNGNIYNSDFINRLEKVINSYGVSPALIELGISTPTNRAVHERFAFKIRDLHNRGFSISMPEFYGSIYSEILLDLPYSSICVNFGSFYSKKTRQAGFDVLLFAKSIARRYGFDVHVQGVDNEEILNFLKENDIHLAQGTMISEKTTLREYEGMVFDNEDLVNQEAAEREKAKLAEAVAKATEENDDADDDKPDIVPELP